MKKQQMEPNVYENVYEIEVWNKAIEAAAKLVDQANREGPYKLLSATRIRELKK